MTTKNKQVLLSVVLPLLNASDDVKGLFVCLHDQIKLDKKNIEVIIVNDGSTDNTIGEINKYNNLLKDYHGWHIIKHTKREGLAVTRVDGVNSAKGKYITFIDKKCRPDKDYLYGFISKNRNIIIGNPYVDKTKSLWGRVLALIRIKLYYPYFNHPFEDIDLDYDKYVKFKNKGGGGSMFVLKKYYMDVSKTMPKGIHINDDSLFVSRLTQIEPILKTASARLEYLNRTGFIENVIHLYNRGPKFINFYAKPGSRFFLLIIGLVGFMIINIAVALVYPLLFIYEFVILLTLLFITSLYLSEDFIDFTSSFLVIPIAITSFSCGVIKGLLIKLLRRY